MTDNGAKSTWRETCETHIGYADGWDMSHRENRAELRRWKRRLFWAKYGFYRAAVIGSVVGGGIGIGITNLVLDAMGVAR